MLLLRCWERRKTEIAVGAVTGSQAAGGRHLQQFAPLIGPVVSSRKQAGHVRYMLSAGARGLTPFFGFLEDRSRGGGVPGFFGKEVLCLSSASCWVERMLEVTVHDLGGGKKPD